MASRNITFPLSNIMSLFARGSKSETKVNMRIAPHPEDGILIPEPKIGSKNYVEERLRADSGKYHQIVGRNNII